MTLFFCLFKVCLVSGCFKPIYNRFLLRGQCKGNSFNSPLRCFTHCLISTVGLLVPRYRLVSWGNYCFPQLHPPLCHDFLAPPPTEATTEDWASDEADSSQLSPGKHCSLHTLCLPCCLALGARRLWASRDSSSPPSPVSSRPHSPCLYSTPVTDRGELRCEDSEGSRFHHSTSGLPLHFHHLPASL